MLPLLGGFAVFFGVLPPLPTKTRFTFYGDVQDIQTSMIPRIVGRSYAIEADVHVPQEGAQGVLVAFADFIGGFSLWVDEKGYLHHTYQYLGIDTYKQSSTRPIPTGDVRLTMLFEADAARPGAGGNVTLLANGEAIGGGRMDKTISLIFTTYAGMDIGRDNGGVVDLDYEDRGPYAFTGTVDKVVFDLKPQALEDEAELHRVSAQAGLAQGAAG